MKCYLVYEGARASYNYIQLTRKDTKIHYKYLLFPRRYETSMYLHKYPADITSIPVDQITIESPNKISEVENNRVERGYHSLVKQDTVKRNNIKKLSQNKYLVSQESDNIMFRTLPSQ